MAVQSGQVILYACECSFLRYEGYPAGTIGENRLLERLRVKIYLVQLN